MPTTHIQVPGGVSFWVERWGHGRTPGIAEREEHGEWTENGGRYPAPSPVPATTFDDADGHADGDPQACDDGHGVDSLRRQDRRAVADTGPCVAAARWRRIHFSVSTIP